MPRRNLAHAKAAKYLQRIAETVGALISAPVWMGDARYDASGYRFLVSPASVQRINIQTGEKQSTCVQHKKLMPPEEMVATLLLLLHDDPKRFETWRRQAGYAEIREAR